MRPRALAVAIVGAAITIGLFIPAHADGGGQADAGSLLAGSCLRCGWLGCYPMDPTVYCTDCIQNRCGGSGICVVTKDYDCWCKCDSTLAALETVIQSVDR